MTPPEPRHRSLLDKGARNNLAAPKADGVCCSLTSNAELLSIVLKSLMRRGPKEISTSARKSRERMVTIVDVSRRAGVSTATISRVINNPEVVDEKTRKLVQRAIDEMDYRPNQIARGLVNRSSRTIGVVINTFSSAYYGRMLDGVDEATNRSGWKTLAESSRRSVEGERNAVDSLMARQCNAIVLHSDYMASDELRRLMQTNTRLILMNRCLDGFEDRCVYLDNYYGGQLAARHLHEKGHRQIATITGPKSFYQANDRLQGFINELHEAGIDLPENNIVRASFSHSGGAEAFSRLVDCGACFTAAFFHSDEMAAGALEEASERGIQIPDDVSFVGFDDMKVADYIRPKLTTVRQPLHAIGEACGELAYALATGGDASKVKKVFKAEIIERASVASLI